ncbi:MAG: hypothetical protein M0R77_00130 [Gammaproteobacteria bacterium]|nr:hypothetical protein [Acholeplasmataceae bacterium]MCK9528961.1 hypothetical protein [Gammaproteobacteria bacterium]
MNLNNKLYQAGKYQLLVPTYQEDGFVPFRERDGLAIQSEVSEQFEDILGKELFQCLLLVYKDSHNDQPYHNLLHMVCVADIAYQIALASKSEFDVVSLLLAGLFHDSNHSGGFAADDTNIRLATNSLRRVTINAVHYNDEALDEFWKLIVKAQRIIVETEYMNGKFTHEPTTFESMCIRDADLLMVATPYFKDIFFPGLVEEMKVSLGKDFSMTYEDNLNWLKKQVFYTEAGKQMLDETISN